MKARELIERMSPAPAPAAPPKTKPAPGTAPGPARPDKPTPHKRPNPFIDPNVRPGTEPQRKAKAKRPEYGGLPDPVDDSKPEARPVRVNPPYA